MSGHVKALALVTFKETVRSKILYSVLFFAVAVVGFSSIFGRVTIGDQVIMLKDFGLLAISLGSILFIVISGGSLLQKDLSKKTIFNILSKPVHRSEFLFGKYLGMVGTVLVLIALMGLLLTLLTSLLEEKVDLLMFQAYGYIALEALIICAAAIFFSALVVTPLLSGLFTFSIFLAGRSSDYINKFTEMSGSTITGYAYWLLPHLDRLNIGNGVVYGESPTAESFFWSLLYVVGYSGCLLTLGVLAFSRRQFN